MPMIPFKKKEPEPEPEPEPDAGWPSIEGKVFWKKYEEAKRAGFDHDEDKLFAISGNTGHLRRLVSGGCPRDLLANILL
jgi:hypothetical protein